jgi:hypothetical protein
LFPDEQLVVGEHAAKARCFRNGERHRQWHGARRGHADAQRLGRSDQLRPQLDQVFTQLIEACAHLGVRLHHRLLQLGRIGAAGLGQTLEHLARSRREPPRGQIHEMKLFLDAERKAFWVPGGAVLRVHGVTP